MWISISIVFVIREKYLSLVRLVLNDQLWSINAYYLLYTHDRDFVIFMLLSSNSSVVCLWLS